MEYMVDMDMPTKEGSCLVYMSSDTPIAVEDGLLAESVIVPAYITPELLRTMVRAIIMNESLSWYRAFETKRRGERHRQRPY